MTIDALLPVVVAALVALYATAAVARWPHLILTAIPVLLLPATFGGLPVRQGVVAVLLIGCIVSARTNLRRLTPLVLALIALTALLLVSHYLRPEPILLLPNEARNSMLTLVLNLWLVLAFALVRPSMVATVKTFALSGVVASAYSAAIGDATGGRLVSLSLNPNSAGHAAALATLACLAAFKLTGQRLYLALALIPFYVVLLTQSRGGLVVLGVGLIAGWVLARQGKGRWFVAAIGATLGYAFLGPLLTIVRQSLLSTRSDASIETDSRFDLLETAARLIGSNPLGVGYGRFPDLSRPYLGIALNAHNDWLRIAAEAGIAAGLLLLFVALARFRYLSTAGQMILAAGAASMSLGNVATDLRVSVPMWVFAGLAWGAWSVRDESPREQITSTRRPPRCSPTHS